MTEPNTPDEFRAPSKRTLLEATGIAAAVALAVLVLAILPAEYGIDPTGFGAAIGIKDIAAPAITEPNLNSVEETAYRNDTVEIVIPAKSGLEYKFQVGAGSGFVYSWNATGLLYFDFHGEPEGDTTGYFESYEEDTRDGGDGNFRAPFTGSHGWYWKNNGGEAVTVVLETAGHYEVEGVR